MREKNLCRGNWMMTPLNTAKNPINPEVHENHCINHSASLAYTKQQGSIIDELIPMVPLFKISMVTKNKKWEIDLKYLIFEKRLYSMLSIISFLSLNIQRRWPWRLRRSENTILTKMGFGYEHFHPKFDSAPLKAKIKYENISGFYIYSHIDFHSKYNHKCQNWIFTTQWLSP